MSAAEELLLRPASSNYKTWPGLENPSHERPVRVLYREWFERQKTKRFRRKLNRLWYCSWRGTKRLVLGLLEEISTAERKSFVALALGAPVALLAVDPVRELMLKLPYAWRVIAGLAVLGYLIELWHRYSLRKTVARNIAIAASKQHTVAQTASLYAKEHTNLLKEMATRRSQHPTTGSATTKEALQHTIATVLVAFSDLTRDLLHVSGEVRIHANLMVRMSVSVVGENSPRDGCGIVAYSSDRPANPSWTRLACGDFGAGRAFEDGQVQVIEDTRDPYWCGVFDGIRSRSFVSLPVHQKNGKVVAVVNIDADAPRVFTTENCGKILHPILTGPLNHLAEILYYTRNGALLESGSPEPRRRRV